MNIIEFALKMEMDGKAFYERLAAESSIKNVQEIFTLLAHAEQRHYDLIQGLKSGGGYSAAQSGALDSIENVFVQLDRMKETHGEFQFDRDGYRHAIKAEDESVRLYQDAAEKEHDENARNLFQKLADEERKHLEVVTALYEHMEAPRTFLEWAEFSNLKRL